MGQWFEFVCSGCDYKARASGGPDAGMLVSVRTMTCLDCAEVVDVVTNVHSLDEIGLHAEIGRCSLCKGDRLERWGREKEDLANFDYVFDQGLGDVLNPELDRPDWGPCPKCGAAMRRGAAFAIWD